MQYSCAIRIALLATLVMLTSVSVVGAQKDTDMSKSQADSLLQIVDRAWSDAQSPAELRADRVLWIEHMHRCMLQVAIGSLVLDPRDGNFQRIEEALLQALIRLRTPQPYIPHIVCPPGTCPDLGGCTECEPVPWVRRLEGISSREK